MLVLTRGDSQSIYIGDNVTLTVVRARNGRVQLGFDAPKEVRILRAEVKEAEDRKESEVPA
jgi:carbon storage regulator